MILRFKQPLQTGKYNRSHGKVAFVSNWGIPNGRAALGVNPTKDWVDSVEQAFMKVAPKGMSNVFTVMCGSCANENAFKTAFMYKAAKQRGGQNADFSPEELSSCMKNQAPGSPDMAILSFTRGFHGRLFGSLTATASKAIHKVDIPAFDWPKAPFPQLKYPLEENEAYNREVEAASLKEVEKIIQTNKKPIAAVVVEPIQSEGGDNHGKFHDSSPNHVSPFGNPKPLLILQHHLHSSVSFKLFVNATTCCS